MNPDDLLYYKEHTWVMISGDKATVGITDYAQDTLGDIVYVDIPEPETEVVADTEFSEIESTKATSSVMSPISGTITEVNEVLTDTPEIINEDPYGKGWIAILNISGMPKPEGLMDYTEYSNFIEELK